MSYTKKASITIDNTKVSGKRPLGQTSLIDDANLVSYWPLDGNSNDEAGSNNGTDTDIAYSNSYGRFVEGADFDGTGDNIVVGTTGIPSGNSNFTWVFWMHPDGFPSGNILWYANSGNSLEKIGIQLTNGGNVRAWVGGGTEIDSTDSLNDGEWNLVMIGYDGGATNKWYFGVNGNYESKNTGQNDLSLGFSSKAPAWGYGDGAFGNDGDFQLDELACFSKVLSQSEYEELWENTSHSNFPVLISGT